MNEHAFKAISALYERHASAFAKMRPVTLTEKPWLDRFINQLPPEGHILDVGCGNGSPVAEYLLSQGFRVTGIDSSPSMIEKCRMKFPLHTWLVGDMRELNLGKKFDGILAWDSFFHLNRADQRNMFALFAAHAKTEAALMFNAGPEEGEAMGEFQGEPLAHASLSADEYASLLHKYGFKIVRHIIEDKQCGGRTVWLSSR